VDPVVDGCTPTPAEGGEAKNGPQGRFKILISGAKFGAGDGIRTHDPNLGKVAISISPDFLLFPHIGFFRFYNVL